MLIVVTGTVASGKSSLSRALADEYERRGLSTAVIDLDLVYEMIGDPSVKKDDPPKWQLARRTSGVLAANFEREGIDVVVVDGEFLTAAERSDFTTPIPESNAPLYVTLRISVDEALRRVESDPRRTFSRDRSFLKEHYANTPLNNPPGDLVLQADSSTPTELARRIVDWAEAMSAEPRSSRSRIRAEFMFARVERPDGSLEPVQTADVSDKPEIGDYISLADGRHVQVTGYALDEDGHLSYLVVVEAQ